MIESNIGDRIREIRKLAGLTTREFGERIGVNNSTVSMYEAGKRNPINSIVLTICKEFGVSRSWLVDGEGEMYLPAVDDPLPGILASRCMSLPEHVMMLVRALSEMDDDWYEKLDKVLTRLEEEAKARKAAEAKSDS